MKSNRKSLLRLGSRGSAFITALLFTFMLTTIVAAIIKWSLTERRLNQRNAYWLEARNAAEAVAEYGFSQIATEFSSLASPPSFDPAGSTPLAVPPASYFAGGNVDTAAWSTTHTTGLQVIGGTSATVPTSGALYYIDPADPNNRLDPLKGQWVYRRDIQVLARATVVPASGDIPVTAFVTQKVSVRGAPLFSHAIFYSNNDLEIFPGPTMNVYGPVHCNGNMFISSQGSSLSFHGPVSLTGNIYHAWSNSNSAAEGTGGETIQQSPVNFVKLDNTTLQNLNSSGTTTSAGASTDWKDSTWGASNGVTGLSNLQALVTTSASTSFRQYAAQQWSGNLQTGSMGIQAYNPVAFNEVVDSAGDKPDPHVLIDPPNPALSTSDPYYTAKNQVEGQKMSTQTGLYIQVDTTPAAIAANGGTPPINFYGPPGSAPTGTPAANIGPNGGIKLNPPANLANSPSNTSTPPLVKYLPFRRKSTVTVYNSSTSKYDTTSYVYNSSNTEITSLRSATTSTNSGTAGTTNSIYTDAASGAYGYGMYDQRRGTSGGTDYTSGTWSVPANDPGMTDIVQVDMKALNAAVASMVSGSLDTNNSIKTPTNTLWGASAWNGGVYIDVKTAQSPASAPLVSSDYPSNLNTQTTSVRLVNGQVSTGSSLLPSYGPNNNGLTIATNTQAYIMGNFNADGSGTGTSAATTPDDGNSGAAGHASAESPVCVAADAVTILSNSWSDAQSLKLNTNATSTEVASALLVGLQGTTNTASSGGAHNLPRFLESWSGDTLTIRGSLVTMYNAKVANQPWSTRYYSPPARNWGFDQIFQNGNYPPITPKVMSYRRITFTSLSPTNYTANAHTLWPSEF
jgi:hypothetical protein